MISIAPFIEQIKAKAHRRAKYHAKILERIAGSRKKDFVPNGKVTKFSYMTICRKASFKMVSHSLYSFYKNSTLIPHQVIIVSDGSWDPEEGKTYFSNLGYEVFTDTWKNCAQYHKEKGRESLYNWAQKHIWGKKIAAILKYAEFEPVLFSDPDILWYGTPFTSEFLESKQILKLSIDNSHNYDKDLINKLSLQHLYDLPPVNCGVVLAKGNLFDASSELIIESIKEEAENPGAFAEQTIFALMANEFGSTWNESEITASINDIVSPLIKRSSYSKELIARHYVWALSWLYWRDIILKPKIR